MTSVARSDIRPGCTTCGTEPADARATSCGVCDGPIGWYCWKHPSQCPVDGPRARCAECGRLAEEARKEERARAVPPPAWEPVREPDPAPAAGYASPGGALKAPRIRISAPRWLNGRGAAVAVVLAAAAGLVIDRGRPTVVISNRLPVAVTVALGEKKVSIPARDSVSIPAPSWQFQGRWDVGAPATNSGRAVGDHIGDSFHATLQQSIRARRGSHPLRLDIGVPSDIRVITPRITNHSSADLLIALKSPGAPEHNCHCIVPPHAEQLGVGAYMVARGPATLIARTVKGKIVQRIAVDTANPTAEYVIADHPAKKRRAR